MSSAWKNHKWVILFVVLLIVFVVYIMLYPPGGQASGKGEAVAKVNGVSISKDQVYDAMFEQGGEGTVDFLINQEIVRQEAEKAGVTVTQADIDAEIAAMKESYGGEEEFAQILAMYGMTEEDATRGMDVQVMLRKLLEPDITITDEAIQTYYDENLESFKTPEEVKASHILVATKEEADALRAELANGADFAEKAKEKSLDTETKDNGGDLDFFAQGAHEEAFDTAAFALDNGELSEVVQTSEGYHIIKRTDYRAATTPTLEEKKEEIRKTLKDEELQTRSTAWMEEKTAAADIERL